MGSSVASSFRIDPSNAPVRLISERVLDIDDSAEDVGDGAAITDHCILGVVNETCQQD